MNKKLSQQNQQASVPPLSQSALNKLLDNQAKELELRSQELIIRKTEIDHNQMYALSALEAQKEDRSEVRQTYKSVMKIKTIVYSVCFIAILGFACFALLMGESQIIMEVLKISLPAVATSIGGFYFGKNKGIESEKNKD